MNWIDIASIVFVSVTANHLGLVKAIEDTFNVELHVANCPKCASCWLVFAYMILATHNVITSFAVSFLASYAAIWIELFEGFIDKLYMKLYDKIYPTED